MSNRFLKPALRGFDPYVPGQQPPDGAGWVKLNTNESPWPPSPRVLEAVRAAVGESLRLYPSPTSQPAREAIARLHGVAPEQVTLGNGADDVIAVAFRAFAGSGRRVAFPHPSYPLLEPLSAMHESEPVRYALTADWELPEGFADDPAPLKFLVNPNSPTGSWVRPEAVRGVVNRSAGVVVVDEAYVDFAPGDCMALIAEGPENLLVMRTLSKSYALAGMRIGYAVGPPGLIAALDLVKDSYNLDRLAIVAAVAAVEDRDYHDRLVRFVVEERAWLAGRLRDAGFEVPPSAANFLFTRPAAGRDAAAIAHGLRERGVLVRHYDREPIAGWLRVTIGTREQHERLLAALQEVMG
jgi:histidinol-phosphate aminotransferase